MRRSVALAALIVVIAIAAAGTVLWITGILRPAPEVAPGVVRSATRRNGALDLIVDVGGARPVDRAGETVRRMARTIATGGLPGLTLVTFDIRAAAMPLMRLAYDPGVLASGAVSGGSGDHMLGLAGAGSRWPTRQDPRVADYCGRMETMTQPFCKHVTGG